MKHTPIPYKPNKDMHGNTGVVILDADGKYVATADWDHKDMPFNMCGKSYEQACANAQFIVKACNEYSVHKKLERAAQKACDYMDDSYEIPPEFKRLQKLLEALAKARE